MGIGIPHDSRTRAPSCCWRWRRSVAIALAGCLLAILAAGCGGGTSAAGTDEGKTKATTSTTMITDLVTQIGGDRVEVTGLMGPGVDPHLHQASQGDLASLQGADVIFYNGLFLEGKMGDILEKVSQQKPTVQVTEAIPEKELLAHPQYEGQFDPHVWFDVTLWKMTVDPVVEQLSELDPASADYFEQNGESYKQQLDELNLYVEEQISTIPEEQRVLVTAHDAFNYFGRKYNMEVRGLQGISTEAEAGAADVQELADFLTERTIKAIFVESSVPPRNLEAVQAACRDRGWELEIGGQLYSDAGGDAGTEAETYIGMVRENVDTIVEALA
jgi:manganese/zinc/iron transport system substrate-binding protein